MPELKFLTPGDAIAIHRQVMAASDQNAAQLVRPEALESAVHSARNLAWYEGASAAEIAVHLTIHLSLARPWMDGNKRTAATAGIILARYNGARQLTSDEALAFGQILIRCVESNTEERDALLPEFVQFVEGWFD